MKVNVLDDIVKDTRKRFENKCEQEVIPELATEEWLKRCSFPLGMNDDGDYYDLEISLDSRFRKIGETNFRNLYHQIVYIKSTPELKQRFTEDLGRVGTTDGFLAYGYIDNEAGFSFRVLCSATIENNKLLRGKFIKQTGIIIRKSEFNDCEYIDLSYCDIDTSDFEEYIAMINSCYKCKSQQTEEMRSFGFLDDVRNIDFPDDIQIILVKEGLQPEQVWGKCWTFTKDELFAKLLNEPNQDFGVHNGSVIGFSPVEQKDGILCVYTGRQLEEKD